MSPASAASFFSCSSASPFSFSADSALSVPVIVTLWPNSLVNQQLALAGWALAPRINDDGVHRRVDDLLFAERESKGMIKEI